MDDLMTWLRAQLDEDEQVARAAGPGWGPDSPLLGDDEIAHMERWDPVRVLAEVEFKRWLFEQHAPVVDGTQSSWTWFAGSESQSETVLRRLAVVYADRPGYREDWRL